MIEGGGGGGGGGWGAISTNTKQGKPKTICVTAHVSLEWGTERKESCAF